MEARAILSSRGLLPQRPKARMEIKSMAAQKSIGAANKTVSSKKVSQCYVSKMVIFYIKKSWLFWFLILVAHAKLHLKNTSALPPWSNFGSKYCIYFCIYVLSCEIGIQKMLLGSQNLVTEN